MICPGCNGHGVILRRPADPAGVWESGPCPACQTSPDPAGAAESLLLTSVQVALRLNVSVRTVWRLVAGGNFPQPVRYNRKLVRWRAADVEAYVEQLETRRREGG